MVKKIFNSHKSVIFLKGSCPNKKLLNLINFNVPLIAADGACSKMIRLGFSPTYIVGDMDSNKKKCKNAKIIHISDQNFTDFEKCLTFAQTKNLFPCLIMGINGGEIDHIIGNVQVMVKYAGKFPMYFLDTYKDNNLMGVKIGVPLADQLKLITKKKTCLSIIAFEKTTLNTKGLKWEFSNGLLHIDSILGLRNSTTSDNVEISVKKGKALIILDITNFLIKKFSFQDQNFLF